MKTFRCELGDKVKTVEAREPTSAARKAFGAHYMSHWEEVSQGEHCAEVIEVKTGNRSFVDLVDHG